ncbi:hypothetical protein BvRS1_20910 [Burkholderia vietnamiensis]|nr:hypothetical protein BvRS1_20910 [Burkholderia vietnamiensis]
MAGARAARPDRPPPAPAPAPIHPRRRTHASPRQRPSARPVVPPRGGFGSIGRRAHPYDTAVGAAVALVLHYWGARTGIRADKLQLDDDEG